MHGIVVLPFRRHKVIESRRLTTIVLYADAGLKPGDKVSVAHIVPGWQQAGAGLVSVSRQHVVGQEGAGVYSIVLGLTLRPSSYAVLLITH